MEILVKVDYLSCRLNDKLDYQAALNLFNRLNLNEETGELSGLFLEPHQYSFKPVGTKDVIVCFFKGGEQIGMELAKSYGLDITRLDLALDFPCASSDTQDIAYSGFVAKIDKFLDDRGWKPSKAILSGRERSENGTEFTRFWSQNGPKSLAVYKKRILTNTVDGVIPTWETGVPSVRLEYRLRNPHAQNVFNRISEGYPDNTAQMFNVWQSLTGQFMEPDLFELGDYEEVNVKPAPQEPTQYGREAWFKITVAKAGIRYFKDTGIDILAWLVQEQKRVLKAEAAQAKELVSTTAKKRAARLQYQSGQKASKIRTYQSKKEREAAQNAQLADI